MSNLSSWAQWIAQSVAQTVCNRFCHPTATYRLQFEPGKLTFRDVAGIVPYLDELGVSHIYALLFYTNIASASASGPNTSQQRLISCKR
jgi:hypothetical protein